MRNRRGGQVPSAHSLIINVCNCPHANIVLTDEDGEPIALFASSDPEQVRAIAKDMAESAVELGVKLNGGAAFACKGVH